MKTGTQNQIGSVEDYWISRILRAIVAQIDGRLVVGDNIQGKILRGVFFPKADFDLPVVHNLGRVLNDYLILGTDLYTRFRRGQQTPTKDRLYLQSEVANVTADILIWG